MLRDRYIPKINKFTNEIVLLEKSNMEVRECIKEFDIAMTLKCNKSYVDVVKSDLMRIFTTKEDS